MQNTPLGFTLLLFKVSTLRGIVRSLDPLQLILYHHGSSPPLVGTAKIKLRIRLA